MILHTTLEEWAKGLPEDDRTSVVYVRVPITGPRPSDGGHTVRLCNCRVWLKNDTPVEVEVGDD